MTPRHRSHRASQREIRQCRSVSRDATDSAGFTPAKTPFRPARRYMEKWPCSRGSRPVMMVGRFALE